MDHGTIPFVCEIQPNIVLVMCFVKGNKEGALLTGFVNGLAILSMLTALLLGPTFILLALLYCIRNRSDRSAEKTFHSGIVTILVVGAGYNMTSNPLLYLDGLGRIYTTGAPSYQYYLLG